MRSHREANTVACPLCGAKPDANCVNTANGAPFPIWTVHRERVTAWNAVELRRLVANDPQFDPVRERPDGV